jgi:hypothetical protein
MSSTVPRVDFKLEVAGRDSGPEIDDPMSLITTLLKCGRTKLKEYQLDAP